MKVTLEDALAVSASADKTLKAEGVGAGGRYADYL
jgi:hypothetical protein